MRNQTVCSVVQLGRGLNPLFQFLGKKMDSILSDMLKVNVGQKWLLEEEIGNSRTSMKRSDVALGSNSKKWSSLRKKSESLQ